MEPKIIPVILAGGSGSRLWPLSRESYPKQFLSLLGQHSLLQETVFRTKQAMNVRDLLIVTNEAHYFICLDQISHIGFDKAQYVLEPCARNTAPAIALAAQYICEHMNEQAIMLVLPADHFVNDITEFSEAIELAAHVAMRGRLVVFGVKPVSPKTGYGYIQIGQALDRECYQVKRFTEKPAQQIAEAFLTEGGYYWNSGMFAFRPQIYLNELQQASPEIFQHAIKSYRASHFNKEFLRVDRKTFMQCPSDSIDYAVMEKTTKSAMIPLKTTWNDLGCWASIAEVGTRDENNNFIKGNVLANNSKNCVISTENRLVVAVGVNDQIIVSTPDALLVADKKFSQEVKQIVNQLQAENNSLVTEHRKVFRPWGYFESLAMGNHYQVKHLIVKPGAKLSLQLHHHRCEHWVVVSGEAEVVNGDKVFRLRPNQSTYIDKKIKHRLSNPGTEPLHVIEVQSGDYLGEDDIVRFEDVYARHVDDYDKVIV